MNFRLLFIIGIAGALSLSSCKTTEKNYHDAYEVAKIQKKETTNDPAITKLIEEEKRGRETVINNDTVRVKSEFTTPVESNGKTPLCGIVVGNFKQIFNAQSFKTRLISKGYKDAYLLKDRDGTYFVMIQGFDTIEGAAAYLKNFKNYVPFAIPIKPYILSNARF